MTATVTHALDTLREAEASLRKLASDAVTAGDYASAVQVTSLARALGEMVNAPPLVVRGSAMAAQLATRRGTTTRTAKSASRGTKRAARKHGYPRFFRTGDQLVRIAWSKRDKKEYQHKTPRDVLQSLIVAMQKLGTDDRIFSTDQLLPIQDAAGNEVPNYQAYVGIAFLKQTGLIDQHGRQGYSIPNSAEFKGAIEAAWQKLAHK